MGSEFLNFFRNGPKNEFWIVLKCLRLENKSLISVKIKNVYWHFAILTISK